MEENLKIWNDAKRIVVKVGSSLVTNEGHGVDTEAIARWTAQIAKLQEMGKQSFGLAPVRLQKEWLVSGGPTSEKNARTPGGSRSRTDGYCGGLRKKLRALRHPHGSNFVDPC